MNIPESCFSIQLERSILGGFLNFSDCIIEFSNIFSEKDLYERTHSVIFSVLKNTVLNGEKVDKILIAQKIKDLGIRSMGDIDIFTYLDDLSFSKINKKGILETAKELQKLRIRRDLFENAAAIQAYLKDANNDPIDKIISHVDSIYNSQLKQYHSESDPVDLYAGIETMLRKIAENPIEETGLITPFPIWNSMLGGLIAKNGLYFISSRSGEGKALEENTLIPTPYGYSAIKDLKIGDEVFAIDGTITKVINKMSWKNRPIYNVTTDDGHTVLADENHEWVVKRRADYKWETLETKFIANNPLKSQRRCKLPLHNSLQLKEKKLPIDPYILGIWLGDGTSTKAEITNIDNFIIKKWKKFGKKNYLDFNSYKLDTYSLTTQDLGRSENGEYFKNIFLEQLRQLNLFNNKHIPDIYLRASIEQRKALLQGLIDSDGFVHPTKGETEFCNKNKRLAEGVLELVHSLGIKARLCKNKSFLYKKQCVDRYRIKFYYDESALLPRKRQYCKNGKRTPYRYIEAKFHGYGNTVCIEIAHNSHIYLCGKAMIPTHNSCYLFNMAKGVAKLNRIKVLILDTEMSLDLNMFRAAAAESQVNSWYLRTGKWIKNPELSKSVIGSFPELNKYKGSIYHMYSPNKDIKEIQNIIKRFHYKEVGKENIGLYVYDYLKITSDLEKNRHEWQQLGDKVSALNETGYNLNSPMLSAGQQNRDAIDQNKRYDDSITTAASDRINQYACFGAVFREKTLEEIADHGANNGTHLLKPFKTSRTQGQDDWNRHKKVRTIDHKTGKVKYEKNFINYEISEFLVRELNTYQDIIRQQALQANLQTPNPHNHGNNNI